MTRELLQQALDALENICDIQSNPSRPHITIHDFGRCSRSAIEIRAHLAKPQGEPERPSNCGSGHCSCIECVVAQETCKWMEDAGEMWETTCGEAWAFTDGGPVENGVKFCHGCGKPVEIVEAT